MVCQELPDSIGSGDGIWNRFEPYTHYYFTLSLHTSKTGSQEDEADRDHAIYALETYGESITVNILSEFHL